jgi:hypothetical protein
VSPGPPGGPPAAAHRTSGAPAIPDPRLLRRTHPEAEISRGAGHPWAARAFCKPAAADFAGWFGHEGPGASMRPVRGDARNVRFRPKLRQRGPIVLAGLLPRSPSPPAAAR